MHRIRGNQLCWWLVCNSLLLVSGQAVAQQTAGTIAGHRSPVDLAINITDVLGRNGQPVVSFGEPGESPRRCRLG